MKKISDNKEIQKVFDLFEEINRIPRESKNEKKIIDFLVDYSQNKGWKTEKDKVGNLLVTVTTDSKDFVCLQSHVDMVCVKRTDSLHDFSKNAVELMETNGYLASKNGTTIGADNGVGVVLSLVLAENKEIPNLELLFTVDEETGLNGARNLNLNLKSKTLINLDSDKEGAFFIGCAGAIDFKATYDLNYFENKEIGYELSVCDLPGGHSGTCIHENHRVNAILLAIRVLLLLDDTRLVSIDGGQVRNSIPKSCVVKFVSSKNTDEIIEVLIAKQKQYPELNFNLKETEVNKSLSKNQTDKLLKTLFALPSNVTEISNTISNLIQTSCNFGTIKTEDDFLEIGYLLRSSNQYSLEKYFHKVKCLLELGDFNFEILSKYNGWLPNQESRIVKISKEAFTERYNKEPEFSSIHAGIECGLFISKFPEIDTISLGPNILNAHSPEERVEIKSVESTYLLLKKILEKL